MRDFKSYSNQNSESSDGRDSSNGRESNGAGAARGSSASSAQSGGAGAAQSGDVNNAVNMATMLAKAFAGKSEGQIWQTILAQAEQGKRDGTLTNADLDNFFAAVAPFVDGFKRKKLSQIIERLKNL
jgi:hypothetical protein